jgi:hypothetical protein
VKASPTNTGVIVVYRDDNYFDMERLMPHIEEGRDKIAAASKIGGERFRLFTAAIARLRKSRCGSFLREARCRNSNRNSDRRQSSFLSRVFE